MLIEQIIPSRETTFNFRKKRINNLLRSPKSSAKAKGKTPDPSVIQSDRANQIKSKSEANVDTRSAGASHLDADMPLGLKSHSTENLSKNHISNKGHRNSLQKDSNDNAICNLPLPLSLALGITSLSDSKLYSYHNSQDFLTFLTKGARDVEEAERNSTIHTALNIIKELKELVEENTKLLNFIRNTQEYNPSSEIDDVMVGNITETLDDHRHCVCEMSERAKGYKTQLILAESDLDTNNSQHIKADLQAMRKSLSWMSMIVRYHMWGSNVAEESLYHSDDDVVNQRRKLGRRNCIRVRERPRWSEEAPRASSPLTPSSPLSSKAPVRRSSKAQAAPKDSAKTQTKTRPKNKL